MKIQSGPGNGNGLGKLYRGQNNIVKQALDWNPHRGQPAQTWQRTLTTKLKRARWSWGEMKRVAQDKSSGYLK